MSADDSTSAPPAQPRYAYFKGPSAFSIYDAMAQRLDERGGEWAARHDKDSELAHCQLVLGDRFDIPYERLRTMRTPPGTAPPLVCYFKGSHRLTLKASMAKLLRDIPEIAERMPATFVVGGTNPTAQKKTQSRFAPLKPAPAPTDELPQLRAAMAASPETPWIVKPSAGCKGKGIIVTRCYEEVASLVADCNTGDGNGVFAVQQYLPNPMLIGGRKFDIRVWALLAPPYDVLVFNQGSCRTASAPYSLENLGDAHAHLTNHDLQQDAPDFGKHEAGNELWYSALAKHIAEQFPGKSFEVDVKPQILRLVAQCLCAAKELLEVGPHEGFRSFQLFGFDLLLDDALTVKLIEINGSPGSAERWLEPMVAGLMHLVDESFPPTSDAAKAAASVQDARLAAAAAADGEGAGWDVAWRHTEPLPFVERKVQLDDAAIDGSCVLHSRPINKTESTKPTVSASAMAPGSETA